MKINKCKLGDLLYIKQGYAFKSEKYVERSQYRLCTLGNFDNNNDFKYNDEKAVYYPEDFPMDFLLNEGDLVLPLTEQTVGLFGNSAFIPHTDNFSFVLNQRVGKVIAKDCADIVYLHYLLSTSLVRNQIEATASGTKQRNTSPEKIYDVDVWVPDKTTQEEIGAFLHKFELKIQNNTQVCRELEAMAKTLYDYWFTQFDFPNKDGKPYRSSGGEMIWNNQLKREIPKGWDVTSIGKVTHNYDSKRIPLSQNERNTMKGEIPYYGATGIMDYVNRHIFDGQFVLIAEDGSVMDTKGNPVVQMIWGKTWVNNHAHVLQGYNGYSNELLYLLLQHIPVIKIMTGSIQKKINQDNLNGYKIPKIPDSISQAFHDVVKPMFEKIRSLQQENNELTKLRDWVLPMLMNGQATVE